MRLRILFLANFAEPWNNASAMARVLRELGHEVIQRHEYAVHSPDELLGDIDQCGVDCLLFSKARIGAKTLTDVLDPSPEGVVEVLRRTNVPGFMWYVDRVVGFDAKREQWMRSVAPFCRICFVTDGQLLRSGWGNFRILRQGVFREYVETAPMSAQPVSDIAFVGGIYGDRERELAPIRRKWPIAQIQGAFGIELGRELRKHRIILGPRFPSVPNYWSDRIYLILGHGAFFLAPEIPGMGEEGFEPNVHYGLLGNDPVADVRRWLADSEGRNRIARAGQELVLSRFTYRHRLNALCSAIAATLPTC